MLIPGPSRGAGPTVDPFKASVTYLGMYWGPSGTNNGISNFKSGSAGTLGGAIELDSAYSVFGPSSLNCVGAGSKYISYTDSVGWDAGANGLTVETYIRRNGVGVGGIVAHSDGSTDRAFEIAVNGSGDLGVVWSADGSTLLSAVTTSRGAIPDLTWAHVAVTYNVAASEVYCHVDGVLTDTIGSITGLHDSSAALSIGRTAPATSYLTAHLQGVRIARDARYGAANFTPPTLLDLMASIAT